MPFISKEYSAPSVVETMAEPARHIALKAAVGYVRCSTEMQEDSPEQQKKEILAFAEKNGYTVLEWFEDFGKSGTTFRFRPEFQRLARIVEGRPTFRAVICYDESRWGRAIDAEENGYWRFHFRDRGVDVVLVKTSVDRNNDFAPMLSAFEGVQASQYSKKLSELTLRGAKANGIYSNGGTPPYGYIRIAVNLKAGSEHELKPGEWCVSGQEKVKWGLGDPEEIKIVQLIFARRVLGIGYPSIAWELNRNNISCPKRGRWRNADQKWSEVTVRTIIENPSYYGARIYNRNSMSKIQAVQKGRDLKQNMSYPHWENDPKEWIIVEGAHEPIVTKEQWMKANSYRQLRDPLAKHVRHRSPYLLSGLIRCSKCNFTFQGWTPKARKKGYPKYADSGWINKHVCSPLAIRKELVEEFAIKAIKEIISDPIMLANVEKHLKELIESQPLAAKYEVKKINDALREIEGKIKNITDAIEKCATSESLLERLRELEQDRNILKTQLSSLQVSPAQEIDISEVGGMVRRFMQNFEKEFARAPIEEKKVLVKKMISEIIVDRDKNVVRFYVRCIPTVNATVENLIKKGKPTGCVGFRSSGGRT